MTHERRGPGGGKVRDAHSFPAGRVQAAGQSSNVSLVAALVIKMSRVASLLSALEPGLLMNPPEPEKIPSLSGGVEQDVAAKDMHRFVEVWKADAARALRKRQDHRQQSTAVLPKPPKT